VSSAHTQLYATSGRTSILTIVNNELRRVQLKEHAIISDDRAVVQRVGEAIWQRYTGSLDDSARQAVAIQGAMRLVVFVKPTQVVSWNHRKLGSTY
jgi:hypothetical protein